MMSSMIDLILGLVFFFGMNALFIVIDFRHHVSADLIINLA